MLWKTMLDPAPPPSLIQFKYWACVKIKNLIQYAKILKTESKQIIFIKLKTLIFCTNFFKPKLLQTIN